MSYDQPGKKKKVHPADAHAAVQVARASHYAVAFRKGPHETFNETAATVMEAREIEARMNRDHGMFGRRAIVSAITPEGVAYPLPG